MLALPFHIPTSGQMAIYEHTEQLNLVGSIALRVSYDDSLTDYSKTILHSAHTTRS